MPLYGATCNCSGEAEIADITAGFIRHAQIEERIVTARWRVKRGQVQAAGVIQIWARVNTELGSGV